MSTHALDSPVLCPRFLGVRNSRLPARCISWSHPVHVAICHPVSPIGLGGLQPLENTRPLEVSGGGRDHQIKTYVLHELTPHRQRSH